MRIFQTPYFLLVLFFYEDGDFDPKQNVFTSLPEFTEVFEKSCPGVNAGHISQCKPAQLREVLEGCFL